MGVGRIALVALVGTLSLGGIAAADEIVVRGDTLHGTVVSATSKTLVFETVYGKGNLEIPIEDVRSITTDKEYVFSHGDDDTTQGRIVGVEAGVVLVGPEGSDPVRVRTGDIQLVQSREAYEESPIAAAKSRLRYWSGNLDLGFTTTQSTVDSTSFGMGLGVKRVKAPTRFSFDSGFTYGTQRSRGEPRTTLSDQLFGEAREEYDLTDDVFGYGNGWLEYNGIQRMSVRGIPEAGLGYKFWKSSEKDSTDVFAGTIGGSWVYEKYFGGLDRDYVAVAFGLQAQLPLPYGATFTGSVSYLPSVTEFTHDYLVKMDAAVLFPLYTHLALKFSIANDDDNTPAPGTSVNYLTTMVGVSGSL